MSQQIEPTYLRYICDGLAKGAIHPDNASALPDGLIGLYEEAFEENLSAVERHKLLEQFAIWALLKKEVSANFVAEVLDVKEENVLDFIAAYSKWFNSPEPGKYQLYHERLRVFLFQKFSEQEIASLHDKLVNRLEKAILEQKEDEFEVYGLEFLSEYLYIDALYTGIGKKLVDLAYSQSHWQRQLNISKGYTWSKKGLKLVMTWASKHNDDEVIGCGLQMVDLHHQEQNGAPQIVALVADGDFDSALKRIEQFGGNDKDGIRRKFFLYMLCLMELTLLDSKDKPFRKEGIEKLLKHLDEQWPVDHSVLNWNDFFPSNLIARMAIELQELRVDYMIIYKRNFFWNQNDENITINHIEKNIQQKNSDNDINTALYYESFLNNRGFSATDDKYLQLKKKFDTQLENNDLQNSFIVACNIYDLNGSYEHIKKIISHYVNIYNYNEIYRILFILNTNKLEYQVSERMGIISTVLEIYCNRGVLNESHISIVRATNQIEHYMILAKCNNRNLIFPQINKIKDEALSIALSIDFGRDKADALITIAKYIALMGEFNESISIAGMLDDYRDRKIAFNYINQILRNNSKKNEAIALEVYYEFTERNINCSFDDLMSDNISSILDKAICVAQNISNQSKKIYAYEVISSKYLKDGHLAKAEKIFEIIFKIITQEDFDKIEAKDYCLSNLSVLYSRIEDFEKAKYIFGLIVTREYQDQACRSIAFEYADRGYVEEAEEFINKISDYDWKPIAFKELSILCAKEGKIVDSLRIANRISEENHKNNALQDISIELAKQGMNEEALRCARTISDACEKSWALKRICFELTKSGLWNLAVTIGQEIPQIIEVQRCWQLIARKTLEEKGSDESLIIYHKLCNQGIQSDYLKGWVENLNVSSANKETSIKAINFLKEDIASMKHLLFLNALNKIFFENATQEKIDSFNKVLDLQWAIDIKNQLPN